MTMRIDMQGRCIPGAFRSMALLALAYGALCATAAAQERERPPRFELTPYAAYRVGGEIDAEDGDGSFDFGDSNAYGLILDITANANGQWEVLYARQETDLSGGAAFDDDPLLNLDIEHYHFGGTYLFDGESTRPFVALTVGLARLDPETPGLGAESYLSASLGGGVQFRADKRVGVRLEGRVFATFVDTDGALFCESDGGIDCLVRVQGTALAQFEARAGIVFRF